MQACTTANLFAGALLLAFVGCSASTMQSGAPASEPTPSGEGTSATETDIEPSTPAEPGGDEPEAATEPEDNCPPAGPPDEDGEKRTTAAIARLVCLNRKPIRKCYEKAQKELPGLKGTMTIHFVLDPEGKIKKAELNVERSEIKAPPVVDCAINHLKTLNFPPSSRGMETTVNYPFNFKP